MAPRYDLGHLIRKKESITCRPGIALALYSEVDLTQAAAAAADVLESYLEFVPPGSLDTRWTSSGTWASLTPRTITLQLKEWREKVTPKWVASDVFYGQGEPPGSVGTHAFRFRGVQVKAGDSEHQRRRTSSIGMEFPLDLFDRLSPADFIRFVVRCAARYPFSSGNAGLAFKFNGSRSGMEDVDFIHQHLPRHLGIDPGFDFNWAGARMRGKSPGAHWLNLLGAGSIAALGGDQFLRSVRPEIETIQIGDGLLLRSAEHPPVGDRESGAKDLAWIPEISRLLRPLSALYGPSYQDWVARYDGRTPPGAPAWPRVKVDAAPPPPTPKPARKEAKPKKDPARAREAKQKAEGFLKKDQHADGFLWLTLAARFGDRKAAEWAETMEEQEQVSAEEIKEAYREIAGLFEKGGILPRDPAEARSWRDRAELL